MRGVSTLSTRRSESIRLAEEKRRAAGYDHLRFFEAGFEDFDAKLGESR